MNSGVDEEDFGSDEAPNSEPRPGIDSRPPIEMSPIKARSKWGERLRLVLVAGLTFWVSSCLMERCDDAPGSETPAPDAAAQELRAKRELVKQAEIRPKLEFLKFLDQFEESESSREHFRDAIAATRRHVEELIDRYRNHGAADEQVHPPSGARSRSSTPPVESSRQQVTNHEVIEEEGRITGYAFAPGQPIPDDIFFASVPLDESLRSLVSSSVSLLKSILGPDHEVAGAFGKFDIRQMRYEIYRDHPEQGERRQIVGTVAPATESRGPVILIAPPIRRGSLQESGLLLALVLFEEHYHAIDPEIRHSLYPEDR